MTRRPSKQWTTSKAAVAIAACAILALPARAAELTIGRAVSASAMDPGFLREAATLVDNVFDTLVARDASMKLVPGLALSWSAVDDQTWEFRLRPGVTFTNGEPFDAAAVKFTLDRVLDPAAKSPTVSYIRSVAAVEVVDPLLVRIRTNGPDPLLPARMSRYPAYIVPPAYIRQVGNDGFARKPIGTGAYRVTEFVPDDHVTMEANPAYWRGKPAIDKATWRAVPEPTARLSALRTGEVQLIENVPVVLAPTLAGDAEMELVRVPRGGLTIYLGLKLSEKPLDDVRVRRALSMAIDRKTIVAQILKGYATATGTQASAFDFGGKDIAPPAFDPAAARKLLADAGLANGFSIRMQTPRRYIDSAEVGQVIAEEFGAIGVKVDLEVPEWSVYSQQVPAAKQAPVYMLGWGSTQTLDADASLFPILHSGEPYSTVAIPQLDALLDASRRTIDTKARAAQLEAVQDFVADQVPLLPLYQEDAVYAKRRSVTFSGRPDARMVLFDMRVSN